MPALETKNRLVAVCEIEGDDPMRFKWQSGFIASSFVRNSAGDFTVTIDTLNGIVDPTRMICECNAIGLTGAGQPDNVSAIPAGNNEVNIRVDDAGAGSGGGDPNTIYLAVWEIPAE